MFKDILKIIAIFLIGMAGGIFADQVLWPYFGEGPFFYNQLANLPVSVNEAKKTIIQENVALQEAIEKVEKAVAGIRAKTKDGKTISGSGIVMTSDGLIVTLAELVPQGGDFVFFVDGKTPNWQILKRDLKNNLALIKVEEKDLVTVGFAQQELELGERIFLLGVIWEKTGPLKMVNEGIVKFFNREENGYIRTNIYEKSALRGSALFNVKGELLGLNTIDSEGIVAAIPISKIRAFVGF